MILAVMCIGCGDTAVIRPGDVRVYTTPKPAAEERAAATPAAEADPAPEAAD